jgi:hypothetical protein
MPPAILNIAYQTQGSSTEASAESSSGDDSDAEVGSFQVSRAKTKLVFIWHFYLQTYKTRTLVNGIGLNAVRHLHLREAGKSRADSSPDRVRSRECDRQG